MSITKQNTFILLMLLLALFVGSCRKQYHATEKDMADYGWFLFEKAATQSNYTVSKNWFLSSVNEDTMYMDGYNGLGWSYGKITDLDSSIYYFVFMTRLISIMKFGQVCVLLIMLWVWIH